MKKFLLACIFLSCLVVLPAFAAIPEQISIQGRLVDSSGVAISSQTSVTFTIYDAATSGNTIHTETLSITPDSNGIFSAVLGKTTAFSASANFASQYWLEISVGGSLVGSRQPLSAAPYALSAKNLIGGTIEAISSATYTPAIRATNSAGIGIVGSGNYYGGSFTGSDSISRGLSGVGQLFGAEFVALGTNGIGSRSMGPTGVYGIGSSYGGSFEASGKTGKNYGGHFTSAGTTGRAVYGHASNTGTDANYGGYFVSDGPDKGIGVYGSGVTGVYGYSGSDTGVKGLSESTSGTGVYGQTTGANGYAGYFEGGMGVRIPVKTDSGTPTTTPASGTMIYCPLDNCIYLYSSGETVWKKVAVMNP